MISHVEVRNFQSLHHVELELQPLTVIVGPSNVGKSAFTRALRTLTSNKRGSEFITHGEKLTTISARTDKGTVTLTRGRGTNDNSYTVIPDDDPAAQRIYSKLGGETPEEVSLFLGIESRDPINYAGQFDKPYLLDDSAGEVARTLGALTNVNVIFEGARESNRRKGAKVSTLRTRAADLEAIQAKVPQYRTLKSQIAALDTAEQLIEVATRISRRIAQLTEAAEQLKISTETIRRLKPYLDLEIPDEQPIIRAAAKLTSYRDALLEQRAAATAVEAKSDALKTATTHEQQLATQFAEVLGQLAGGIKNYVETHGRTLDIHPETQQQIITVDEAAELAAKYISETLK